MKLFIPITTIQRPTASVRTLQRRVDGCGATLVIAGDSAGPAEYELENTVFLSLEKQLQSASKLAKQLPTKHYARKNTAYLYAIANGADCIYETDDDNAPNDRWMIRDKNCLARVVPADSGWVNAYRYFSESSIWPRGFPLDEIKRIPPPLSDSAAKVYSPIQQGLINRAPDVDAIWRLLFEHHFDYDVCRDGVSVFLPAGSWCPFNTQSTWWWPDVFPLLYVPSYCSFRMCDIWKSLIAQRCLWELNGGVTFHSPEATQDRNQHDLMRDFADEIPGYLKNKTIARVLRDTCLEPGPHAVAENLRRCYVELIRREIFPGQEISLVDLWLQDLDVSLS
jgi:hypothetical protein